MLAQDLVPLAMRVEPNAQLFADGLEGEKTVTLADLVKEEDVLAKERSQLLEVGGGDNLGKGSRGRERKDGGREVNA